MGEIRDYCCSCGYQKTIFAGGGINGCNLNVIKHFFPKETEVFEQERQAGKIRSYLLANVVVTCTYCKKIESVPCFSYQTEEGNVTYIKRECSDCGKQMLRIKDEECVICPKCGLKMDYHKTGNWD